MVREILFFFYQYIKITFYSLAENGIDGQQIASAAFDGAYFSCHVPDLLREELQLEDEALPCVWDWMHSAGLSG